MIEVLFNELFSEEERILIRSRSRAEPTETMRKAWILLAYMYDYSIYDIAWCIGRKARQAKYLLAKAEDLFSVNDKTLHGYFEKYERKMDGARGAGSKNN